MDISDAAARLVSGGRNGCSEKDYSFLSALGPRLLLLEHKYVLDSEFLKDRMRILSYQTLQTGSWENPGRDGWNVFCV